ncbi:MAG: glycosyltransferase family protein [Bosea sp. (in: a-proteobacteria)]
MSAAEAPRALIYVQHLLGVGHLARISRIAAALRDRGVVVTLVRGGTPVAGFDVQGIETIQLDPIRALPGSLDTLVGEDGLVFGPDRQVARREALLDVMRTRRPDILLIEAFPFGRRAMRFELMPLLEEARRCSVRIIACSIRDILQRNAKPGRAEEIADIIERHFDLVLCHGDEQKTPLSASFALADRIAARTVYTGLVGPEPVKKPIAEHAVIVSAGGGAVGATLLRAAIEARPLTALASQPWLVITGPNMEPALHAALTRSASPGIEVRAFVGDLPARLAGARLSISQAGYNTVAEIAVAGCPSVLVPFEHGGETEQVTRALSCEARGVGIYLREADLNRHALAEAAARALSLPRRPTNSAFEGAARTAELLLAAAI